MNIREMTPEQIFLAENIVSEAEKSGINPNFALKLIFQETQFSPSAIGETPEEIQDNIRVFMGTINDLRESIGDDPLKIAAGFFAGGSGERFAETKNIDDLPPEAILSASDLLQSFGGNIPSVFQAQAEPEQNRFMSELPEDFGDQAPRQEVPEPTIQQIQQQQQVESETGAGRVYGGALGAVTSAGKGAVDLGSAIARRVRGAPAAPSPGGALPGPAAAPAFQLGTNIDRQIQGTTEEGLTGRQRQTAYNEETAQRAAKARQAQANLGALAQRGLVDPQKFANLPGMQSTPSGLLVGRSETPRYLGPRGPQGQIGPTQAPAPPKPSNLDQVTKMFQRMADSPLGSAAKTTGRLAARYGLPPLTIAAGGGELLGGIQEAQKDQPDPVEMALRGLGVLGAGMSLFPATAPVGIPLAIGAPLLRENRKKGPLSEPQSLGLMAP